MRGSGCWHRFKTASISAVLTLFSPPVLTLADTGAQTVEGVVRNSRRIGFGIEQKLRACHSLPRHQQEQE